MEEEKLEEAKRTFEEDCEKFNRYLEDVEQQASQKADDVKQLTEMKNMRTDSIFLMNTKIKEI